MSRTRSLTAGAVLFAATALVAGCSSSGSSKNTPAATGAGSGSATSGAATSGTSSSAAAPGTAGKAGKVVYIPGLTGNPFYNTVSCGASTEAKKLGVQYSYQGSPTFDVGKQTQIVNAVLATKPGAIMISITDPKAMIAPLTAAKRAGVKIIGIDGDLTDKSVMTTNIQANGMKGAELAGEALAKQIGYKGTVMTIDNATGSIVAQARDDGFAAAIKKYPKIKYLGVQYSNNDISKAASIVSSAASSHSDLVGVFGAETNNTQGALTGVREANKTGKIKVVGFDTSDPIVAALKDGSLAGTVVQFPRGEGMLGVQSAVAAMQGKSVPRDQTADAVFVTPATVNSAKAKQYIYDVNCKG